MTELEWLTSPDRLAMLDFLQDQASDRKLRLFAVACCRRLWPLLNEEVCRETVRAAERYADGLASEAELRCWRAAAEETCGWPTRWDGDLVRAACGTATCGRYLVPLAREVAQLTGFSSSGKAQADLVRDLFGPLPFRTIALSPAVLAWDDHTIPNIAQTIYWERAFDRVPILGDALEEAGCADQAVLLHLRGPGPHVRGCWALDAILSKDR
jgi:hypothetical protein